MSSGCPSDEEIAAFLEGRLSSREAHELRGHVASCEECCAVMVDATLARKELARASGTGERRRPTARSRTIWIAGSLAATIVIAVIAEHVIRGSLFPRRPAVVRGLESLIAALGTVRATEVRLTGGISWAPLDPRLRSEGVGRTTPLNVLAAAAKIREEATSSPTSENLHALGVAHAVVGALDDAVATLRLAVRQAPGDARVRSDLGAVLLERGDKNGRPDDLVEGLSCIEQALGADAGLIEARFNRAVALEKLHLDGAAIDAWEDYLRAPEPGWGDEARQRLARLKARTDSGSWEREKEEIETLAARGEPERLREAVTRRTQETREWVDGELLGVWAERLREGRAEEARKTLDLCEELAAAHTAVTGDPMLAATVATVRNAVAFGSGAHLDFLVRGQGAYSEAAEAYRRFQVDRARALYEEAESMLQRAGSPLALWAADGAARCEHYLEHPEEAARRNEIVLAEAERKDYLALAACAHWLHGLLDILKSRYGDSLAHYQRALSAFRKLGEHEHVAFLCSLLATNFDYMGDEREALRASLEAVSGLDRVRDPGRAVAILIEVAITLSQQGYGDVAYRFQQLAVKRAKEAGDSTDILDSLIWMCRIASTAGRDEVARASLAEAGAWIDRVPAPAVRGRLQADLEEMEARLTLRAGDPGAAYDRLTRAIAFFSGARMETRLPELYLQRARASRARGDAGAAEHDLLAGIESFEQHREAIPSQVQRVSYFDTAAALFDEIIGFEADRGRGDEALAYLEREKTRELRDTDSTESLGIAALCAEIPKDTTLIAYAVLEDRLLLWVLARNHRELAESHVSAAELGDLVHAFREEVEGAHADSVPAPAMRLHELLVAPARASITGARVLAFVPDKMLHALPFAALREPSTGKLLVESHAVVVAPSVALFLRASRAASERAAGAPSGVLAVGDPSFDQAAYPYLSRLSDAAAEARRVGDLYPSARVLTGDEATRTALLDALGDFEIVHVAAHAAADETNPMRSRLLLAPDAAQGDSGTLFAEDLYGRALPRTRLVVLAGCATAAGRISRGEGPLSLARPFLADGVPSVLATLWEIEDVASSDFMTRFHRGIASGAAPEDALRDAQLALIASADPALRTARVWAAFQLVGGVAHGPHSRAKEG